MEQQTITTEAIADYEIVVVDDGLTDDTLNWL